MSTLQLIHITNLQTALIQDRLWSATRPTSEALASSQPFAIDTLEIEQWLQFLFIPKITDMLSNSVTLPNKVSIKPIVEQSFATRRISAPNVLQSIDTIDQQFSGNDHNA